jgi:predicted ABC-type sugar transport system permease subunit
MLGPLPYFHRIVVIVAVVMTAVASGAWIAHFTIVPVAVGAGAVVGGLTGLVVAYALVHPATHTGGKLQPVRNRRR